MAQLYQDAMAITQKFGPPSLFITMTANPDWPEIKAAIPARALAYNHPTVVAQVFALKVKALIFQLTAMQRLGTVIAYVYTIEFQKRGLPHIHLMLTLDEKDRLKTPEDIDLLVLAKLPDPESSPDLHQLVSKFMLHGPCWDGTCCSWGIQSPTP
jgi:hypothetical protein